MRYRITVTTHEVKEVESSRLADVQRLAYTLQGRVLANPPELGTRTSELQIEAEVQLTEDGPMSWVLLKDLTDQS